METKKIKQKLCWLMMLVALMLTSQGAYADDAGFFEDNMWRIKYYDGSSDKWAGAYKKETTQDLGIKTTLYLKGADANTWSNGNWGQHELNFKWSIGSNNGNWTVYNENYPKGDCYWIYEGFDVDLISNATNKPGVNTVTMSYKLDQARDSWGKFTFTIPGFTTTSTSKNFENVAIGKSKGETISFGTHYGTALTTSNCSLDGTNKGEFSVTGISESGVTVSFNPTSAGNKSATLTITDAHSKKCTITLSGNGVDLYVRGDFNDWKTDDKMTYSNGVYTKTININLPGSGDTHDFKIATDDFGDEYGKDNATMGRTTNNPLKLNSKSDGQSGNVKLTVDRAGDYTFSFDISTKNLTVTYPPACTAPTVSDVSGDDSMYLGDQKTYSVEASTTTGTISGYSWALNPSGSTGLNGESSTNSITLKATTTTTPGTHTATVTVSNSCGESTQKAKTITVNAVPAPKSCSISVTNAVSGDGTQVDPYIVRPGASYTVQVTATKADGFTGSGYAFNINNTSSKVGAGTTASYSTNYTAGAAGTSAEYTGYAWHYNVSEYFYSSTYATSSKIYVSVQTECTTPDTNFAVTGQLNSTAGSTWAGTKGNPANDGVFGIGHNTATLTTEINADQYEWFICDVSGNPTANTNVTLSNSDKKTATATFKLPGQYHFRLKAKCSSDANYTNSATLTVNVPFPVMRIEGPIIDAGYYNCFGTANSKGAVMDIWGTTWYKEFFVVGDLQWNNFCFRVGEQYLTNEAECTGGDAGWDSGNNILSKSSVNSTLTKDGDHFAPTGSVKRGDKVKVEVVMNDITASGTGVFSVNLIMVCSAPTAGFDITGQLNAGQGSQYEGSVADGTLPGTGGYFADSYRTITLNSTVVGSGYQYEWVCTSANSGNVTFDSQTGQNTTADVSLPGTYTFKQQAKCTGATDWVESEEITVVVPEPEMRVSGPFYTEVFNCTMKEGKMDGQMEHETGTLVWTKEFNINNSSNQFEIIQRYKDSPLKCENTDGTDGWNHYDNWDGVANKIKPSETSGRETGVTRENAGNNFKQSLGLSNGTHVKLTVTMNAWNNYSVTLERMYKVKVAVKSWGNDNNTASDMQNWWDLIDYTGSFTKTGIINDTTDYRLANQGFTATARPYIADGEHRSVFLGWSTTPDSWDGSKFRDVTMITPISETYTKSSVDGDINLYAHFAFINTNVPTVTCNNVVVTASANSYADNINLAGYGYTSNIGYKIGESGSVNKVGTEGYLITTWATGIGKDPIEGHQRSDWHPVTGTLTNLTPETDYKCQHILTKNSTDYSAYIWQDFTTLPVPTITVSPASPKAYEVITLGTVGGGEVTWEKPEGDAYFVKDMKSVEGNTVVAESIILKAPSGATSSDYTITATPDGGCTGTKVITVSADSEVCN